MKNLWSKEDLANFENSEVFMELEKRVLANISRADILYGKISNASVGSVEEQAVAGEKAVRELEKAVDDVAAKMADDPEVEEGLAEDDLENEVLDDLRAMAKLAIEKGDFKLAYKIERTIDEILETEIPCE